LSYEQRDGRTERPGTDFDHHDTSLSRGEVLGAYTSMREQCPVTHSSAHGGFFNVTRYEGVRAVTTSPDRFSSAGGVLIPSTPLPPIPPLEFEGAEHEAWRTVMQAPLVPSEVRMRQPLIDDIVGSEIDGFARAGTADLWSDLADAIPALVIARLVGLSTASAPTMRHLAMAVLNSLASTRCLPGRGNDWRREPHRPCSEGTWSFRRASSTPHHRCIRAKWSWPETPPRR
jgi:cytochrome P450